MREFLPKVFDEEVKSLLLNQAQQKNVVSLLYQHAELNNAVVQLSSDDLTLSKARALVDSVPEVYPMFSSKLDYDARNLKNLQFEVAIWQLRIK